MKILQPNTLAILGNKIILNLYEEVLENIEVREAVKDLLLASYSDDIIFQLTKYLIRTYCRMRGKDFCRKLMSADFNNLGKAIRSQVAVLLDSKSYSKNKRGGDGKKKSKKTETNEPVEKDMHSFFNSLTDDVNNDNETNTGVEEENFLQDADDIGLELE